MSPRRLALVTRRYWPLVGGAESATARLAGELRDRGHRPTIVTAQWERNWPQLIDVKEVPVVRLPHPTLQGWGTLRYVGALEKWLAAQAAELDLVYVSHLQYDAYAAVRTLAESHVPVVLCAGAAGPAGDVEWQTSAPFGLRVRRFTQDAAAIVAPSAEIELELLAAGYPPEQLRRIAPGVALAAPRTSETRRIARRVLAAVDAALSLPPETPLAVYVGRLEEAHGLGGLLDLWPRVMDVSPGACLWLVGEGPDRDSLARRIRRAGLQGYVTVAGPFDHIDDVLAAADLCVLPGSSRGPSQGLLEAMAHSLPVVASEVPGNRELFEHEAQGLLVAENDDAGWVRAIARLLDDRELARRYGEAGRLRVAESFSLDAMGSRHEELFEEVIAAAASRRDQEC